MKSLSLPFGSDRGRVTTCAALVAVLLSLPPQVDAQPAALPPLAAAAPVDDAYRIARGDELALRFFYTPELNLEVTVRSDGRVALPLIGELAVEGMTVAGLSALIVQRLEDKVRRPEVAINVKGAGSQRVFVGGEVARPGVQPLLGPLSVVQAVMVAEGFRDTAQPREVVVMRRGSKGEREVVKVNLEAAIAGTDLTQDFLLRPYDVVLVPRSGIANLNLWIDQYVRRNLPISVGFSYSINDGDPAR